MAKSERIILVDADVISHFITGSLILQLPNIFRTPIKILNIVYEELEKWRSQKSVVDNLINFNHLEVIEFPEDNPEIRKEYYHIMNLQFKGKGESACMAVARFSNDIIASSNLKDIKHYCSLHQIDYLTTLDFLCRAKEKNIFSEKECDDFITRVSQNGDKLPVRKMADYECRDMSHIL